MGLEDFIGIDKGDAMDSQAFEKLQERMREASAQIQAIKKEERKQKKKEAELIKILLRFIKTSHKKDLVLLISRVLEKNIPANFVLAIVLLGNEDIQREVGRFLAPVTAYQADAAGVTSASEAAAEKALVFFREDKTMPLKVRIEVDNWIKGILLQASENPQKLLKTGYDIEEDEEDNDGNSVTGDSKYEDDYTIFGDEKKPTFKKVTGKALVLLTAHVLFDFMQQNNIDEETADITKLKEFAEFLMTGILKKTESEIEARGMLEG